MSASKVAAVGCASLADVLGLGVKQKPQTQTTEVKLPPIKKRKTALTPAQAELAENLARKETTRCLQRAQSALGVYARPGQV